MSSLEGVLVGGVAGVAIGEAATTALDPVFEPITQDAWYNAATKILDANQLAQLVATALLDQAKAADEAQRDGYPAVEFTKLVQLALKAPGVPEAQKLWLRAKADPEGSITTAQLEHAYAKSGLEYQYWDALSNAAATALLAPAELALGVVRSTVQSNGLLIVDLDTSDSNVKQYPVAALDTLAEFAAAGIDAERAKVLVGSVGLPMSAIQAALATFRGILTPGAYNQAVLESDTRPEWAPFIFDFARQIATAHEYLENYLRGYTKTLDAALAGAAKHGMSTADATVIFQNMGRPLGLHNITKGLARGAVFNPEPGEIADPYQASVREADLKPGYYDLAIAAEQYTWPGYFVLKPLVAAGTIAVEEATSILEWSGWEPTLAAQTAASFVTTGSAPPHVKSAQTAAITKVKQAYAGAAYDGPQAIAALTALDVASTDAPTIIRYWDEIRKADAAIAAAEKPPVS